ncbi:MAG: HNH endonuclease [Phycisphaerae bacterium]|nr:HNH endonuclease [Phycisphaerae bacterium]
MLTASANPLNANVLMLNKHYAAIRIIPARRAFSLLYRNLAEVVSIENDQYLSYDFDSWREVSEFRSRYQRDGHDWIRCVRFEIAVPWIVRLMFYDRLPQQRVKFNRRNIYARDHSHCQYCGKRFPLPELSLDHVVPRSLGGKATWDNVVCCCVACNVRKGGRTPRQAGMKLITTPVKPKRSPVIQVQLTGEKYASWKQFLNAAYWNVELKE